MSSRKNRAVFNSAWRKFRKEAKKAQRTGIMPPGLDVKADRFNVDLYREKIK